MTSWIGFPANLGGNFKKFVGPALRVLSDCFLPSKCSVWVGSELYNPSI